MVAGYLTASAPDLVFRGKFHFLWYFRCYLSGTNLSKSGIRRRAEQLSQRARGPS
jgi:hypothetical protein